MDRPRVNRALTQLRRQGCGNPSEINGGTGSPPAAVDAGTCQRQFEQQIRLLPIMPRTPLSGRALAVHLQSFLE